MEHGGWLSGQAIAAGWRANIISRTWVCACIPRRHVRFDQQPMKHYKFTQCQSYGYPAELSDPCGLSQHSAVNLRQALFGVWLQKASGCKMQQKCPKALNLLRWGGRLCSLGPELAGSWLLLQAMHAGCGASMSFTIQHPGLFGCSSSLWSSAAVALHCQSKTATQKNGSDVPRSAHWPSSRSVDTPLPEIWKRPVTVRATSRQTTLRSGSLLENQHQECRKFDCTEDSPNVTRTRSR